jgi:hypothetical protein
MFFTILSLFALKIFAQPTLPLSGTIDILSSYRSYTATYLDWSYSFYTQEDLPFLFNSSTPCDIYSNSNVYNYPLRTLQCGFYYCGDCSDVTTPSCSSTIVGIDSQSHSGLRAQLFAITSLVPVSIVCENYDGGTITINFGSGQNNSTNIGRTLLYSALYAAGAILSLFTISRILQFRSNNSRNSNQNASRVYKGIQKRSLDEDPQEDPQEHRDLETGVKNE